MDRIQKGPTNWLTERAHRSPGARRCRLADYHISSMANLPWEVRRQIEERWGKPEQDPFFCRGRGRLWTLRALDPAVRQRGDRRSSPPAAIMWTRKRPTTPPIWFRRTTIWRSTRGCGIVFRADAVIHLGKHGNLEWLPGKSLALSEECFPEAVLGPVPHLYPFIVNDPGEGTQAKRRTSAVIIDHLTPPLTRAETYGPLKELEALVDEYYEASGVDPRQAGTSAPRDPVAGLQRSVWTRTPASRSDMDEDDSAATARHLPLRVEGEPDPGWAACSLAPLPLGDLERDLAIALLRVPRGDGKGRQCVADPGTGSGLRDRSRPISTRWIARWARPMTDRATSSSGPQAACRRDLAHAMADTVRAA